MDRIKFLNTEIDNLDMQEAVDAVDALVVKKQNSYIVTPNVDHILRLEEDEEFRKIYKEAALRLTDGMPLVWISKMKKTPIKEKVSGSDLFPKVCERAAQKGYSVFLLGAAEGVAAKAAENLKAKYPGLIIAGTFSPKYGFEKDEKEVNRIIEIVKKANPDILAVGLGSPKQEKFIYRHRNELNVPVSLAIGASIDFEAGKVKRAPVFMQKAGLEWLYRLCKEPRRMFMRNLKSVKILKVIRKYK